MSFYSARPHTAVPPDDSLRVASPYKQQQSPLSTREPTVKGKDTWDITQTRNELLDLIYHPSDFVVSSIIDNPKVNSSLNNISIKTLNKVHTPVKMHVSNLVQRVIVTMFSFKS